MDFYQGKVLRLNLSAGISTVEPLNMEWAKRYIGGKGLLLRYLWDEVPPRVDPWAPENPIILMTGPFAGTSVNSASRLVVGCKSPQTGILNDSYVGGSFGPEMKFAGYDAIIITGESPEPVVVTIRDDIVTFVPAKPSYWGMETSQIEAAMRQHFDPHATTLSIGPAGENEVMYACVSNDVYHKAGRGGHGPLWGRKKLKAIALRGTGPVSVGDARAFLTEQLAFQSAFVLNPENRGNWEEGTPNIAQVVSDAGVMPTRNWSTGTFEEMERINSEAFVAIRTKNRACCQCAVACRQFHVVADVAAEGPEYETIAICGANCGISDIAALSQFNVACAELALDTISTGDVVALAMDLTERGIKDFGMRFGETEGYLKAPEAIAKKQGIGVELARGARALACKYGVPELAMEVKNLEVPAYDPRGSFGMTLAYATSDRGGCHMRAWPFEAEVLEGTLLPDSLDGKIENVVFGQNERSLKWTGILCDIYFLTFEDACPLFRRLLGTEASNGELRLIGERIWNLGRLFNLREGVEPDDIPRKFYSEEDAHTTGASAGRAVGSEAFKTLLQGYYAYRGWDEHGVPSEAKLAELGVDVRL